MNENYADDGVYNLTKLKIIGEEAGRNNLPDSTPIWSEDPIQSAIYLSIKSLLQVSCVKITVCHKLDKLVDGDLGPKSMFYLNPNPGCRHSCGPAYRRNGALDS